MALIITAISFRFIPIIVGLSKLISTIELNGRPLVESNEVLFMKKLVDVKEFLVNKNIQLIGIEISDSAVSIHDKINPPFTSASVAFMPGNEGEGMNARQIRMVDKFVFIPQYGEGIESLNVNVASSIVLYEYTNWFNKSIR